MGLLNQVAVTGGLFEEFGIWFGSNQGKGRIMLHQQHWFVCIVNYIFSCIIFNLISNISILDSTIGVRRTLREDDKGNCLNKSCVLLLFSSSLYLITILCETPFVKYAFIEIVVCWVHFKTLVTILLIDT